jgi:hypothetical protein
LFYQPWDEASQYEIQISEFVSGSKIIESKQLQSAENIAKFFDLYREYRKNCLPKKPWIIKPNSQSWDQSFQNLVEISHKIYPNHKLRLDKDQQLLKLAINILSNIYSKIDLEFVHGHISTDDLIYQGDQVVLFSHLFWKWKYPFYDAVFGYHWFMYELNNVPNITPQEVESQRALWLIELFKLAPTPAKQRLLNAALLERAIAGLTIDGLMMDTKNAISRYLYDATRTQIISLTNSLK